MLGRGAAPRLEAGVYKNHRSRWAAPAALSRPPPDPTLSFQPSAPGPCGQASDNVVQQVAAHWDLAVSTFGCFPQLSCPVPAASGPATSAFSPESGVVFVMKSG